MTDHLKPEEINTLKESFRKYEHPFDFVIEKITELRQLKSVYNLSSKQIDNAFIYVKNELELTVLLNSGFDIARLCQVNNLHINYVDESNEENNLCVRFGENKQAAVFFENAPNPPIL